MKSHFQRCRSRTTRTTSIDRLPPPCFRKTNYGWNSRLELGHVSRMSSHHTLDTHTHTPDPPVTFCHPVNAITSCSLLLASLSHSTPGHTPARSGSLPVCCLPSQLADKTVCVSFGTVIAASEPVHRYHCSICILHATSRSAIKEKQRRKTRCASSWVGNEFLGFLFFSFVSVTQ